MKRVFKLTVLFVAVAAFAVSCGSKNCERSIGSLKEAITGETGASATYKAFSEKAAEEGYPNIAKMFAAASAAEAIHVKNHNTVLAKLGKEEFNPIPDKPAVGATADNIRAAIEGETYEFTVMYPGMIAIANEDKCADVLTTFTWATTAEATHAKLYAQALQILKSTESDEGVASVWYTCPKCGELFNTIAGVSNCPICAFNSSSFLKF